MKKVTIRQCKELLKERGESLPRVGYEKMILQRVILYHCKPSGLYPTGQVKILQDVYLLNSAGKLSVRYYSRDYNELFVIPEYLQSGIIYSGWFSQ